MLIWPRRSIHVCKQMLISLWPSWKPGSNVSCSTKGFASVNKLLTFDCAMRLSVRKKNLLWKFRKILIGSLSGSQTRYDSSPKTRCMTDDVLLFYMEFNNDIFETQEPYLSDKSKSRETKLCYQFASSPTWRFDWEVPLNPYVQPENFSLLNNADQRLNLLPKFTQNAW